MATRSTGKYAQEKHPGVLTQVSVHVPSPPSIWDLRAKSERYSGPRHPPNPGPQSESLKIVLLKVQHAHKSCEEPVTEQTRFSSLGGAEESTFITALRPDVVTVLGSGQGSPPELPGMVYSPLRALQPF